MHYGTNIYSARVHKYAHSFTFHITSQLSCTVMDCHEREKRVIYFQRLAFSKIFKRYKSPLLSLLSFLSTLNMAQLYHGFILVVSPHYSPPCQVSSKSDENCQSLSFRFLGGWAWWVGWFKMAQQSHRLILVVSLY